MSSARQASAPTDWRRYDHARNAAALSGRRTEVTVRDVTSLNRFLAAATLLASSACGDARGVLQSAPTAGSDLIISRVMADPSAVSDDRGEWIEIANLGADSIDLRGWQLRSEHDPGFTVSRSLVVPPAGTVVLGRSDDSTTNGGVHVDLVYTGIVLGNSGDWLVLRDPAGTTADSVEWDVAPSGAAIDNRAGRARGNNRPKVDTTPKTSAKDVVVRVLDVGQGDAILIQNGGSNVLVDGGPKPAQLGHYLDVLGLNGGTIDAVILTHAHADHYQGLRELFASRRRITVRFFWENQDPSSNVTLAKLRDSIAARVRAGTLTYRSTDDPCVNGQPICVVTLKGGAKLEIMRPDPQGQTPNNRSPAIKLVGPDSASFSMWMAGDAEHEAIGWFARAGYQSAPGMKVDVLKADHHGSCNGVTDEYLRLLQPSLVVASLADVNDYGHMHTQAKAMYRQHGIPWYRTDQNGTITIRSAGVPGSRYSVSVERGIKNSSGSSDKFSTQQECAEP
jgi:competence protein ComEC